MAESEEELKSLLMKVKEESKKVSLKLNIQKMKIRASGPIMANRWGNSGSSDRLYFGGLQNLCKWQTSHMPAILENELRTSIMKSKDACSLEEKL